MTLGECQYDVWRMFRWHQENVQMALGECSDGVWRDVQTNPDLNFIDYNNVNYISDEMRREKRTWFVSVDTLPL